MTHAHLALLVAFASAPLIAQPTAAPTVNSDRPILVEGYRTHAETIVRDTIKGAGVLPLARFEDRICPGVVGLGSADANKLLQLIRDNVVSLGGRIAKPGCTANATVIFTPEPAGFVKKLAEKEPGYFAFSPAGIDQFTAKPRPVLSWHVNEVRDRDGNELGNSRELGMAKQKILNQPAAAGAPMNARVLRNVGATHLYTSSREDMLFGFAVIDAAKIQGKTLEQLAAVATLHLLLDIKQDGGTANPASILSLFDERANSAALPQGLSRFDQAMVQGLYEPKENNRSAAQQFSQIATAIRRSTPEGKD